MEVAIDGERVALVKVDRWISESDPEGLTVTTPPIAVRAGRARVSATFIQEFEGVGRRPDQADRSHAGRHADWRRLRRDDAAAPAEPGDRRPVRRHRRVRQSDAARDLLVPPDRGRRGSRRARGSILDRLGDPGLSTAGCHAPTSIELMPFYRQGAKQRRLRGRHPRRRCRRCSSSLHFLFRVEEMPATRRAGRALPDQRRRSRVAAVVLPLGHDSGSRADRRGAPRRSSRSPTVFEQQVRRMLADPRSDALATRFAAQWLRLQDLDKIEPDALSFPYFDESLAEAMERETELLFEHLVRADRPALELLTADYTFVNERLARHYGIAGVSGPGVPEGVVSRRHAPRPARPRQHPDADVARQPHLAGAARQVGDRSAARQPAAAAAAGRSRSRGNRRTRRTASSCRWPNSSRCTARARRAARATTSSIRSASRSTTSTSPARGASRIAACP